MLNEAVIMGGGGAEVVEQVIEVPASEVPESEISVEVSSEPLYCLCQEPWDIHNRKFMIHCDHCSDWFHGSCIGVSDVEAREIEKYHCPKCTTLVGPSILLDNRSRKTGKRVKSVRCTPEFIEKLKDYKFNIPDEVILKMRGQALTLPWLISKGFSRPIMIESTEGLGMKLPPDTFTVNDVERHVGSDRMVDVIDVERQTDVLMSMREFTEYYTTPNRAKLLNLISLEFTHTNLNKLVEAPYIARKLDWVNNYWPATPGSVDEEVNQRPTVSKYCLISAKDSYTDFHIDFGGTSVWYHVLWGEKVFYLIEPSETNLNLYHRWMDGEMGDECFLADEVLSCFRCVLKKGQTLLIPTGWIHAVYTPKDSLVFGGNFLHFLNMDLQLKVYNIEKQMQMPTKYLFPSFEAAHWFAAARLIQDIQSLNTTSFVPAYLVKGIKALINSLRIWAAEKELSKVRREYIPAKLNCKRILQELSKECRMSEKRLMTQLASPKQDSSSPEKLLKYWGQVRKPSITIENGHLPTASSESSPPSAVISPPLKLLLSRTNSTGEVKISPSSSPGRNYVSPAVPKNIKMILKKPTETQGSKSSACADLISPPKGLPVEFAFTSTDKPSSPNEFSEMRKKLDPFEFSFSTNSNSGSDALYIAESDRDELRIDTDASVASDDLVIDSKIKESSKSHRKHHHKKCKRKSNKTKHDREQNKALNDVLSGTLNGLEELFKSSKYSERISQCENTSQAIKDSVADMDAMKKTILPLKKRSKHKAPKGAGSQGINSDDSESDDGLQKVHQDEDYIYLPLVDDESQRNDAKNRGRKRDEDLTWSPRTKVTPSGRRDSTYNRANAKRKAVEKGLEKASQSLENNAKLKRKLQEDLQQQQPQPEIKRVKKLKLVPSKPSSSSSPIKWNIKNSPSPVKKVYKPCVATAKPATVTARKPKKGMATPKQRLGKILKINKFTRF